MFRYPSESRSSRSVDSLQPISMMLAEQSRGTFDHAERGLQMRAEPAEEIRGMSCADTVPMYS
jgi:hypothetical protein